MEECVLIDGDILNEVTIPTTNVDRRLSDGSRHKEENVNKSQIYMNFFGQKFMCITLICIRDGLTYKDYALEYNKLTEIEKQKIVSLLSNQ